MYFSWTYLDSTLQELSNGTKNTQIGLRMTKLWSYEVGAKTGKLQPRRDVRNDVATWQRAAETTSRRRCMTSRRSGSIFHGFLAHFERRIGVFKQKTLGNEIGEWRTISWGVFEGEQAPFGWKHPRACSWRDF